MRTTALIALLASLSLPALAEVVTTNGFPTPTADSSAPPAAPTSADDMGATPNMPTGTIFLLGRVQLAGTELDQAIFWQDRTVTTVEACEKIRQNRVTLGWTAFHPYLRTYRGMSYKVDYRCVQGTQRLTAFRYGVPFENFYLVHSDGAKLRLEPFHSFFACQNALTGRGMEINIDHFCAAASQTVVQRAPR
jgi:hypothetical protein